MRVFCIFLLFLLSQSISAQDKGSITFKVDVVSKPENHLSGWDGKKVAEKLHTGEGFSVYVPPILACSFADEKIINLGEDVLFQMLLRAWCQHRPVVLTPDAIWMVISQGFSHYVNQNPEKMRRMLVDHEGKKDLDVWIDVNPFSGQADWAGIISNWTSQIDKYSSKGLASTLVADFSTTGVNERIASEVTLMDAVKPYFDYNLFYIVCGIPSITLTGTPQDWQKVLDKTLALKEFGMGWWVSDLEPILKQFIKASEGSPDLSFWKDIVKKTRPQTIQGPTCGKKPVTLTEFDGWFLKLFPYDGKGRTPGKVTIGSNMLRETVCVPFKCKEVTPSGDIVSESDLELVAGLVGITEDIATFALTPKIGWFVRVPESKESKEKNNAETFPEITMESSLKYWSDGPLTLEDFTSRKSEWPKVSNLEYGVSYNMEKHKKGNTVFYYPSFDVYMNPYTSWLHPDFRNQWSLKYMQTAFDYLEVCGRRAEKEVMNSARFKDISAVAKFHLGVADSFIEEMKDKTHQGTDTTALRYYSERVSAKLSKTKVDGVEDFMINPDGFGLGMHLGIGGEFYTGALAEYVTPIAGLDIGFDFDFGRVNVYLGGLLGFGGHYKKDIQFDGYKWNSGKRMTGGNMELSLGYSIYNSQWWRVSPFAGIGVGFIDYPESSSEPKLDSYEIPGFRYQAGLCADWKFLRTIEKGYPFGGLSEYSIRTRLYVAHTSFPTPAPAWSINFGISANMLGWLMQR
ncbi:MAG: DUF4419 domain-containing protein [Bacteroidales bacterium]|nr:DUF4419 domain-containing protein [Bacteroidales bacterium]